MAIEGNLEHFNLPEILQMVSAQGMTGILTVQGENDIVAISFKDGEVVAADALNQTVEEGLGQVLASQGLVSPKDFAAVTAEHESTGQRLLDLLVERDYIDRQQLLESLRTQTYQLMVQLLRWNQGEFKFYSGDEVAFEEGFRAISVEELLIRSVTDLGEDEQPLPNLETAYDRVAGGPPIKVIGEHGEGPMEDASALWLSSEEMELLDSFDGRRTAGAVAAESGLGEYKVLYTLYRLLGAGVVMPVELAPPPEPMMPPVAEEAPAPPREGLVAGESPFEASALPDIDVPVTADHEPASPVAGLEELKVPSFDDSLVSEEDVDLGADEEVVAASAAVEMPTAEDLEPADRPRPKKPVAMPESVSRLAVRGVAALIGLSLLVVSATAPGSVLLDSPWQKRSRQGLEKNQRTALYQRIDRAARTFFLLEGHYPDGLRELVDLALLSPGELQDSLGRPLLYSSDDVSYLVQPVESGQPLTEHASSEAITGDFLLDPEFLDLGEGPGRAPLVLLDG